jgi:hypothetical protein
METMNTDTPETDEATLRAIDIEGGGEFDAVHVQVSKRLELERDEFERERDEAREERKNDWEKMHNLLNQADKRHQRARRQRDEARGQIEANHKAALVIERMVYEARDQRDRLAEALKLVAEGSLCCACRGSAELVSIAEVALATLNQPKL